MAAKDWAGVTVGLALAGFGLGAFVASGPGPAPVQQAEPVAIVQTVPTVETVVVPLPDVEIPGLSAAAERLLAARGYADLKPTNELGLPDSIVRVLERAGAVLLVPEGGGS